MWPEFRQMALGLVLALSAMPASRADPPFCPGEQERARASALRVNDEWPQRGGGDEVSAYIQGLGERLARASPDGARLGWRFTTIRDRAPFAFAIGYGFIYITDGTVHFAENESILAAVLAHEMGHQLAGHFCRSSGETDGLFSRGEHRNARIGSLNQVIDSEKEQEADRQAIAILRAAGFDPAAMYWVAEHLPQSAGNGHLKVDGRRLRALQQSLPRERAGRSAGPDSEMFKRARQAVDAGR